MSRPTTLRRVRELTGKGEWSEATKIRVIAMYLEMPVMTKISEITGVPAETIRAWKKEPWWHEVKEKILREQDDEISSQFTKIVNKAQKEVLDRLENGDWVVLRSGEKTRKPLAARDANQIINSGIKNRQLLNDRPTSRTESLSTPEKLMKLADEFRKFSKAKTIEHNVQDITPDECPD